MREVLEETGWHIEVGRLAAVAEEISENPAERESCPEYAHRIHHIFLARPLQLSALPPSEPDSGQQAAEWIPVTKALRLPLWPFQLRKNLIKILQSSGAQFLPCTPEADHA